MRKTDCKHITQIISLYVAGDLFGEPEREAAAHFADCQACRQLAEEFLESSSLLTQACAQPQFDAEFYAGIRREVLGKITAEGMAPTSQLFERLWGRRWVYAGALAALVIAAIALQVFRGVPRQPGFAPRATGPATSDQTREADSSSPRQSSESPRKPDRATAQTGQSYKLFARTDSRRRNNQFESPRKPDDLNAAGTAPDDRKGIAPATRSSVALSGRSASSPAAASSPEVSRIEIQTADPNIRIIWFASRESRKSEPTNHDPDPENGDRN
jgi:hypothetical protein